ncbi:MAG: hypothetical protein AUI36_41065 [Cyanobacteria bacterium 13_1_40CM_2_61_4]|nr:MAG: hypothetical protein AUI36_41065 [Cyanobacteria bacterium 13_1_40CM_2_61_4]
MDPSLGYIREPLSVLHRRGICDVSFPYWFPYICDENEGPYIRPIRDMLDFRYHPLAGTRSIRSPRDVAVSGYDWYRFLRYRARRARPLVKDPIAVFSAGWLADRFGTQVVVLIRHPAAFAGSLKRYGWTHPFEHFVAQPLLLRDLLDPYADAINEYARAPRDVVDQAILLWNLIHHVVLKYRTSRPDWSFFRHEDLSREPVAQFQEMFHQLGLTLSEAAITEISKSTAASNPIEASDAGSLKRDSRSSIATWGSRLTPEEIARVRAGVEPLASHFYSESDW